jgi:transcriptional regulator
MAGDQMGLMRGTLDILILRTLAWGPTHGYAISRWIRETTKDELQIEEGALYPALRRLEAREVVESSWQVTETGREAKVYQLTPAGRRQLERDLAGWKRYVQAMSRVIDARPRGAVA